MMALPIVDRELRVAARRNPTYWLRSLLVLLAGVLWLLLLTMLPAGLPFQRGKFVFAAVASLAFAFCLLAGTFLTADCLSREKREGTLGLLFLTQLKGYDVALGKLLATSIHAIYGLLAVFPILAFAMLIGGVTAGEFWRLALVLLAILFCSLSVGILVSTLCRETRQAMSLCLLVMLALAGVPFLLSPAAPLVFASYGFTDNLLLWPSPAFAFRCAFDANYGAPGGPVAFWGALGSVGLSGLGALYLACRLLPERWAEKSELSQATHFGQLGRRLRLGSGCTPASRSGALEANPFCWLISRDRSSRTLAWGVLGALLSLWLILLATAWHASLAATRFAFGGSMVVAYAMHQAFKWLLALEASRRLSEDRASGALEVLLVTPLSVAQILTGQRRALKRLFLGPALLTLGVNASLFGFLAWAPHPAISSRETVIYCELCFCGAALLLADIYALGWVGMRTAFATRRHHQAIFATLARVMLLPWLAILFLGLLIMGGAGLGYELIRVLTILWSALAAVMVLSVGARAKSELVESFRRFASENSTTPGQELPEPAAVVRPPALVESAVPVE